MLVFDLDPGEGTALVECCQVALFVRDQLDARGLQTRVKTSGSKGVQVYAHLEGRTSWEKARNDAHGIAKEIEQAQPELVTSNMRKSLRRGKILIDWSQNHPSKTTIGAYSVRGRALPTVSTPVTWQEVHECLEKGDASILEFTSADVLVRVEQQGDLFAFS